MLYLCWVEIFQEFLIPNDVMQALLRTLAQYSEVQGLPEVSVRDLLLGELNLLRAIS